MAKKDNETDPTVGTEQATGAPAGTPGLPTDAERAEAIAEPGTDGDPLVVGYVGHSPGPADDGLSQSNPLVMNQDQTGQE